MQYSNELYHYGVLGMKWGVRRYQNYDGTYTQKGLERYREAEGRYGNANSRLKEAKRNNNRTEISKAKRERTAAKKDMKKSYKKLRSGIMAQEGKELAANGKSLFKNALKARYATLGLATIGAASIGAMRTIMENSNNGFMDPGSYNTISLCKAVAGVSFATAAAYNVKLARENERLREYYRH